MFEDRGMMEHRICPVSGLDCKLTDYPPFVRYKKLSSQNYFWPGDTWHINRVYWGTIYKKLQKIKLKPTHPVSVAPIAKN